MKDRQRPVRSSDVARLAGVSRSAVSRAFTPGAYIADETRERVMQAAEMLGYSPNAIARSLSKQRSGLIGIIASGLDNPFYAQLLDELAEGLQEKGFATLLLMAASSDRFDTLIPKLLSYQVDGVVLPAAHLTSQLAVVLQKSGRPVVLVNRYLQNDIVSSVSGDNVGGGRAVADLLAKGGHRRVAFMSGIEDTSSSRDRLQGLVDGLGANGLPLFARDSGGYTHDGGIAAARRLLSLPTHPDAIFCANDVMAMAALEIAKVEFRLRVPEDIAIVGYDNSSPAGWPLHQLTSVDQHLTEMARMAVEILVRKVETGDTSLEHRVVPASLVERATTRR